MAFDDKASYYDAGGIETIDIIQAKLTDEEFRGYVKGTMLKYLCRAAFKHKTQDRDLEKAANMAGLLVVEEEYDPNETFSEFLAREQRAQVPDDEAREIVELAKGFKRHE